MAASDSARPFDREGLDRLPQSFDVWQLGARQLAAAVRAGDQAVRPWAVGVLSRTTDQVLAFELMHEPPTAAQAWDVLRRAMQAPEAAAPHRPTEVQTDQGQGWADALRRPLEDLNVGCVSVPALDGIDTVFEELSGQLAGPSQTGLLDMPGITAEAAASFFDAAALFYAQAPWKRTGERPVKIECPRFESGPWYAVVMGQGGMTRGLVLYDDLATLLRIQEGDMPEEESARLTAALAVIYGGKDELPAGDVEALARHGWPVAGANAYPSVYRMEPGLSMRPPLAWELDLLEGCLRAVPEFARKKTRRLAPLSITVPTAGGELPLLLSWAAD